MNSIHLRNLLVVGFVVGGVVSGLSVLASHGAAAAETEPAETRYRFEQVHMGVPVELLLYAPDEATANAASDAAYARLKALDDRLSDFKPDSELSRLSATSGSGQAVKLSDDLWRVLERAQALSKQSGGAFDVTVGPLVQLWRRARRQKELPTDERMAKARAAVGYQHLELNAEDQTAKLTVPNMRLDLGGIAMGFAADEMMQILKKHGIKSALIDASGDVLVSDPPPGRKGWRIGIVPLENAKGPPSRYVELANASVTTSGDAFQYVEIAGRRYSHIVDPKTGLGLSGPSAVTVIANDCLTADSVATAVSVLGPEHGLKLIAETPGAAAIFIRREGDHVKTTESAGFAKYVVDPN